MFCRIGQDILSVGAGTDKWDSAEGRRTKRKDNCTMKAGIRVYGEDEGFL